MCSEALPNKHLEIKTVKSGAELFMVSVKLTATWLSATNPSTTVKNLEKNCITLQIEYSWNNSRSATIYTIFH